MTTTRKPRNRKIRVLGIQTWGKINVEITQDGSSDVYAITPVPNGFGEAEFWAEKWDATRTDIIESYNVVLDGKNSTCTCRGHRRFGYCKHSEGLQALVSAGKI